MRILSLLLSLFIVGPWARAEGVGTDFSGDAKRIHGVQTLLSSPSGLFTLGGPNLRQLPPGKTKWVTLHQVPGDNLYRIAADDAGRVLAVWEKEKRFHLFIPKPKKHLTFPKPPRSPGDSRAADLDGLTFSKDGRDAVVYVNGSTGNSSNRATLAYRYQLDGKSPPVMLFHQEGIKLYSTARTALFAVPRDGRTFNNSGEGSIASIVAYEISGEKSVKRTLLTGEDYNLAQVRMAGGNEDEGLVLVVTEKTGARELLRWSFGQAKGDIRPLPKGPVPKTEKIFQTKAGELVEIYKTGEEREESLQIKRSWLKGGIKITSLPPLPLGDPDVEQDTQVYAVRERKNGGLLIHWGDFLILLGEGQSPRILDIEPLLQRMEEWAGVAIYATDPEALWLGVEVGAGRDFVRLGFDEIEKNAKPF